MASVDTARLRELFVYEPETGELINRISRDNAPAGERAGTLMPAGYRIVSIDGERFYEHRIIWQMVYGEVPDRQIDHRNGNRSDNRLLNLRKATNKQNNCNVGVKSHNTTGVTGVSWAKREGKWRSYITVDGRQQSLGHYDVLLDAVAARMRAQRELFGEFEYQRKSGH